ncbi:hypothetical protein ACWC3X_41215 [Streptomyces populi]|jgi:hypothetical protein
MTTPASRPSRRWGTLGAGAAAAAACAVCCAGPILAVLGSIGVTSAVGALWMPALAVLALAAGLGVLAVRRRTASCHTAPARADLGMPAFGPPPGATDSKSARWASAAGQDRQGAVRMTGHGRHGAADTV